jgi:hypothetical protein
MAMKNEQDSKSPATPPLPPVTGSVIDVTEPLKLLREGYGMRTVVRVLPGWPQAVWVLTCGHRQIIPTWSNGRVNPKPKGKVLCETCWHAEWDKRYAVWLSQNS